MPPRVSEPSLPLWPLPAAALVGGAWLAALPGSPAVAAAGAAASRGAPATALALVAAGDAAFGASVGACLWLASVYGALRHPAGGVKRYVGPWRDAAGAAHPPSCFAPAYLVLALTLAVLAPAGALAKEFVATGGALTRTAVAPALALGPYLALWGWQWALEMRLMRHSVYAPTIPLLFSVFRPWQLARGAGLAAACAASLRHGDAMPPPWLAVCLRGLALFWTFDTAALLVWLPWTYGWQTQK